MRFFIMWLCVVALSGCGVYSFTGVNTSAKSIFIGNFVNRASAGPANVGINFTEKLKEYYQRNSALSIVSKDGELSVTGSITKFTVTPVAATAQDRAAENRLTVEVEVDFVNTQDDKKNFTQSFSFYQNFPQNQTLSQVQGDLVDKILDQIVIDIFNKTVADW
jgi:Lipopolysaccharide-assembly